MKSLSLLENVEFHAQSPYAEPLFVSDEPVSYASRCGQARSCRSTMRRIHPCLLRCCKAGDCSRAPMVSAAFGPNSLVIFDAGENHSIRALNEDLVVLVFLREAPDAKSTEHHQVGEKYAA